MQYFLVFQHFLQIFPNLIKFEGLYDYIFKNYYHKLIKTIERYIKELDKHHTTFDFMANFCPYWTCSFSAPHNKCISPTFQWQSVFCFALLSIPYFLFQINFCFNPDYIWNTWGLKQQLINPVQCNLEFFSTWEYLRSPWWE